MPLDQSLQKLQDLYETIQGRLEAAERDKDDAHAELTWAEIKIEAYRADLASVQLAIDGVKAPA